MKCCLCGEPIERGKSLEVLKKLTMPYFGNSSQPLVPRFLDDVMFFSFFGLYGRCCDVCDKEKVTPARMAAVQECMFILVEESWQCTQCGRITDKAHRPAEQCPGCGSAIIHFLDSKTFKRILPDSPEATQRTLRVLRDSRKRALKENRHFETKMRRMGKIIARDDEGHAWTIYKCRMGYGRPYLQTDQGFPILRNDDGTFFVISPQRPIRVHKEDDSTIEELLSAE